MRRPKIVRLLRLQIALLWLVSTMSVALGQSPHGSLDLGGRVVMTSDEIAGEIGDARLARELVSRATALALSQLKRPRSVRFLSRQLRSDWGPKFHGLTVQRLPDDEARAAFASCDGCWFIGGVDVKANSISVTVSAGNICSATSTTYRFVREGNSWLIGSRLGNSLDVGTDCDCAGSAAPPN